ncbi:methylmalonyl Co-A mutase-associated GTPase MeaB [Jannaschia sp. Os4]|uniref:methylmalonyl Co-A mutase-associated GTPase MeaB n=1 Tax=Jannaschia sp. Os4 TaxID=2807617 RepID=UPI00193A0588|nr:methylmalonyl Co-A mutase-associated GTPase MeaB [Jannaschia sp. Os4]MBM2575086.1 methylmalonyl Co-A mutase-associated GTPase MeaB [Jannaschia sp. Os4]
MDDLLAPLLSGDRRALSRAITLVESTRPDHRARAVDLLQAAQSEGREAARIALSGTPGVGKSTFVEAFGGMLTGLGLKVAVLAVDPSSARTGGSILGDKTRMDRLSRDPDAYVRPSPSAAHLGGVARRTREAASLCEAAGFDVVLIETVGVGQSETAAARMSDLFVLLIAPAGGDELQGVKRGIMETADLILVNKADGELAKTATRTVSDYASALRLLRRRPQDAPGFPKVLPVSAVEGTGLDAAWAAMTELSDWRRAEGHWATARAAQAAHWFEEEVRAGLLAVLREGDARAQMAAMSEAVAAGRSAPGAAAAEMLAWLRGTAGSASS